MPVIEPTATWLPVVGMEASVDMSITASLPSKLSADVSAELTGAMVSRCSGLYLASRFP
jgi:hypothetical protein